MTELEVGRRMKNRFVVCLVTLLVASIGQQEAVLAGPRVTIVLGPNAVPLERLAAEESADQLRRLFDAEVNVADRVPAGTGPLILMGSPATNPALKRMVGARWPKVSDQGHLLRSVESNGRKALVVGGGSPVATLWAAYELGYRFGIRYLFRGDVDPPDAGELNLDSFDLVMEPQQRLRTWRTINDFAIGPESWGLDEHRVFLKQLAKLKFNRVMLSLYPWQPFVDYEFAGTKKRSALSWFGYRYPVDGDTAAKAVFGGAKLFENPALAGKTSYADRTTAAVALARGVLDEARGLGMSTGISINPLEFPKEFAAALPGSTPAHGLANLTIRPGAKHGPGDPVLGKLVRTKIRAYLETYPKIDALYLTLPEFPDWAEQHEEAWSRLDARTGVGKEVSLEALLETARKRDLIASGDRGVRALKGNLVALDFLGGLLADPKLLRRADGRAVEPTLIAIDPALFPVLDRITAPNTRFLHFVDYTARRIVANRELLAQVPPAAAKRSSLILTLADDNVGVLPQLVTGQLDLLLQDLREGGWEGYSTRYWMVGDLDPSVQFLARASFDPKLTARMSDLELFTTMTGKPAAADRVVRGLAMIEKATTLIDENNLGFAFPVPGMVMKQYRSTAPVPAWWGEAKKLYDGALVEMYRAQDGSRPHHPAYLLYSAKRYEFATEYFNSIEALRLAGIAKGKNDTEALIEQLEKAVESMYNGISALGEVVGDNCDRGLIAVLNEYGYRPIQAELERQLEAAEAKQ